MSINNIKYDNKLETFPVKLFDLLEEQNKILREVLYFLQQGLNVYHHSTPYINTQPIYQNPYYYYPNTGPNSYPMTPNSLGYYQTESIDSSNTPHQQY